MLSFNKGWEKITGEMIGFLVATIILIFTMVNLKNASEHNRAEVEKFTWYVIDTSTQETWELEEEPHQTAHSVTVILPETGDTIRVVGNFQVRKMVNR